MPGCPRCRALLLRGSSLHRGRREAGRAPSRFPRQRARGDAAAAGERRDARTSGGAARTFSFSPLDNFPAMDYNTICVSAVEKYSRGRRGAPAKGVGWETAARVQIPPSPPKIGKAQKSLADFCSRETFCGLCPQNVSRETVCQSFALANGERSASRLDGFAVFDARSARGIFGNVHAAAENGLNFIRRLWR